MDRLSYGSTGSVDMFDPGFLGAAPDDETHDLLIQNPDLYCSKHPTFCYETLTGKGIIPNTDLVFKRLYKKADWFDNQKVKRTYYAQWKNAAIAATKGDGHELHKLLRSIIINYSLNPSEQNTAGVCKAPDCYRDPASSETKCSKPDLQKYLDARLRANPNASEPQKRILREMATAEWKRAVDSKTECKLIARVGANRPNVYSQEELTFDTNKHFSSIGWEPAWLSNQEAFRDPRMLQHIRTLPTITGVTFWDGGLDLRTDPAGRRIPLPSRAFRSDRGGVTYQIPFGRLIDSNQFSQIDPTRDIGAFIEAYQSGRVSDQQFSKFYNYMISQQS